MKCKFSYVVSVTLVTALTTFQTPVSSEPVCKGLIESSCSANSSCIWVNGYVTKRGTEVNGYCRIKPGGKSSAAKVKSQEHLKQAKQDSTVE
jgi:hypothetical protein